MIDADIKMQSTMDGTDIIIKKNNKIAYIKIGQDKTCVTLFEDNFARMKMGGITIDKVWEETEKFMSREKTG